MKNTTMPHTGPAYMATSAESAISVNASRTGAWSIMLARSLSRFPCSQ